MRKFGGFLTTCALSLLAVSVLSTAAARAAEKDKKSKADLPQKVKASLDHRFPGADLTAAEKETENGNVVYDLELKHEGRKYEMDVKEDGTIMEIEKEVKAKDVPPAVSKAVAAKFPKATVKEVMEVNLVTGKDEKPDHYEVTLSTDGGKEKEVVVALDGSGVKEEAAEAGQEQPKEKELKEKK